MVITEYNIFFYVTIEEVTALVEIIWIFDW